jgi:hypothetical protein
MDYRSLLLAALCLFGVTLAAILLVTRRQAPREERADRQKGTAWVQVDVRYAVPALIFVTFDMDRDHSSTLACSSSW